MVENHRTALYGLLKCLYLSFFVVFRLKIIEAQNGKKSRQQIKFKLRLFKIKRYND